MSRKQEGLDPEKRELFERAFRSGTSGCMRRCKCGRLFYDAENHYDWEDGEFEALEKDSKAARLSYSVGTVTLWGVEYVMDCDCWLEKASNMIAFLERHRHAVAEYLSLEKEQEKIRVDNLPIVRGHR